MGAVVSVVGYAEDVVASEVWVYSYVSGRVEVWCSYVWYEGTVAEWAGWRAE